MIRKSDPTISFSIDSRGARSAGMYGHNCAGTAVSGSYKSHTVSFILYSTNNGIKWGFQGDDDPNSANTTKNLFV